jgi:F-box/leucine-rich repeat protein 14
VRRLENLESLSLRGCNQITDDGLQALEGLSSLKSLNLKGCSQVTNQGLSSVGRLKNLEFLNLMGLPKITDAGLKSLRRDLPNLKVLEFSVGPHICWSYLSTIGITGMVVLSVGGGLGGPVVFIAVYVSGGFRP